MPIFRLALKSDLPFLNRNRSDDSLSPIESPNHQTIGIGRAPINLMIRLTISQYAHRNLSEVLRGGQTLMFLLIKLQNYWEFNLN